MKVSLGVGFHNKETGLTDIDIVVEMDNVPNKTVSIAFKDIFQEYVYLLESRPEGYDLSDAVMTVSFEEDN